MLRLYRRHRKECEAGHPEDSRSGEFEEHRRGWKRCACPVHVSGSLGGKFKRQSTGQWEWDAAREVAAKWESAVVWSISVVDVPSAEPAVAPLGSAAPKISDATEAFLARCQNRGIRRTTFAKYRTFVRQLNAYAEERGYTRTDQFTVVDMDRFYASWSDGIRSRAKKLERLKSFIRFCKKRNWLAEDIGEDPEAPQGASVNVPKAPFTDQELGRIFSVERHGQASAQGNSLPVVSEGIAFAASRGRR